MVRIREHDFRSLATWLVASVVVACTAAPLHAELPVGPAAVLDEDEVAAPVLPSASAPGTDAEMVGPPAPLWGVTKFLGRDIAPGDKTQAFVVASESFAGTSVEIPALIVRGDHSGPTLCLTAGVHGDELSGVEIVREVFVGVNPRGLSGMLIGLPVVNIHGFRRSSRYLPDRRDLNRYFPGNPDGSSASRIAAAVFESVIRRCNALVDFHTGSFHRTNLPQIRADLSSERLLELAESFGAGVVVHGYGPQGTLRRAATEAGIPAITYEAGEPMRFQRDEIARGVDGVRRFMRALGMEAMPEGGDPTTPQHVYYQSRWVRVNDGGIFITERELGDRIRGGEVLGSVVDPISNHRSEVHAPFDGHVIGMALSQVVIPGFAAFHIGIEPMATVGPEPEVPATDSPAAAPAETALSADQLDAEEHPE